VTNGPYLLPGARAGYRYGDNTIVDATAHDALYCAFDLRGMGDWTEFYSKQKKLTREDQDAYSAQSDEWAVTARKNGLLRTASLTSWSTTPASPWTRRSGR
jgi:acetyl-CoA C-acetyltransferase